MRSARRHSIVAVAALSTSILMPPAIRGATEEPALPEKAEGSKNAEEFGTSVPGAPDGVWRVGGDYIK